jgi:hypothetical protein
MKLLIMVFYPSKNRKNRRNFKDKRSFVYPLLCKRLQIYNIIKKIACQGKLWKSVKIPSNIDKIL